ncbi:DUF6016 domain-containing protein [Parabacteroides gordonii]|nr:DUF6016 domain-containing protein [Parabacteroides gordonii]
MLNMEKHFVVVWKFVEVSRVTLCPCEGKYGVQSSLGVWHSVDVKEPSTIFEAKDGAYMA